MICTTEEEEEGMKKANDDHDQDGTKATTTVHDDDDESGEGCVECDDEDRGERRGGGRMERGLQMHKIVYITDIRRVTAPCLLNRDDITCFRCGEKGHYKSECLHWKTRVCSNEPRCTNAFCNLAHSNDELRMPWQQRCVRIVKSQGGTLVDLGCGANTHTFRTCPRHQHNHSRADPTSCTAPFQPHRRAYQPQQTDSYGSYQGERLFPHRSNDDEFTNVHHRNHRPTNAFAYDPRPISRFR